MVPFIGRTTLTLFLEVKNMSDEDRRNFEWGYADGWKGALIPVLIPAYIDGYCDACMDRLDMNKEIIEIKGE
jgi:hypothetical protein